MWYNGIVQIWKTGRALRPLRFLCGAGTVHGACYEKPGTVFSLMMGTPVPLQCFLARTIGFWYTDREKSESGGML